MENFIVSARKYRPVIFDSVVGQVSITSTLKNAIKNNHVAQAYLFCGPRGVGKTTCARILAKTLNCQNITDETEACGECESCVSFASSRSYNIHELDAASNNSVEDIRHLIEQVRIPPQLGKYSIYIIDEVHMLSQQAFNAFLKTLEEPPSHAIFILATTEKHKILPTILSRCQIFDFNRIQVEDIVEYLENISKKEQVEYEVEAFNIIGQKADGGMRDALSIYDQIVSFTGNKITYLQVIENLNILDYEYYFKLVDGFLQNEVSNTLLLFNDILDKGFDGHNFINGLASHFRDLLVCKDPITVELLEAGAGIKKRYLEQSGKTSRDFLYEAMEICNHCDVQYKSSRNQRFLVELTLVKLCNITLKKKLDEEARDDGLIIPGVPAKKTTNQDKISLPREEKASKPMYKASFNIKQALQKKEEKVAVEEEPLDDLQINEQNVPYSKEDFLLKWNEFLEIFKEDKPRMYHALKAQEPVIDEKSGLFLEMKNLAQQEEFDKFFKSELVDFLRKQLKNSLIKIETKVKEEVDDNNNMLYTQEDKFKHLLSKNPKLNLLKQQFNLDFR